MSSASIEKKTGNKTEKEAETQDYQKKIYDDLLKTKAQLFLMMGKALEMKKECEQLKVDNNNLQDYVGSFMSNAK